MESKRCYCDIKPPDFYICPNCKRESELHIWRARSEGHKEYYRRTNPSYYAELDAEIEKEGGK